MEKRDEDLFEAVEQNDVDRVKKLVRKSFFRKAANVDARNEFGSAPIHLATVNGFRDVVKILVQHGADINAQDDDGRTPLHIASWKNDVPLVKFFLIHDAQLNIPDKDEVTPLEFAEIHRHYEIMKILLRKGADPDPVQKGGNPPGGTLLHRAIFRGHAESVKILLAAGANVYRKDARGRTVLDLVPPASLEINQVFREFGFLTPEP